MSSVQGILELPVQPGAAVRACRAALLQMGWSVLGEDADRIEAREDPARLCCRQSPARSECRVGPAELGSSVAIETTVPGRGPISATHADERQRSLVRRIHHHATERA